MDIVSQRVTIYRPTCLLQALHTVVRSQRTQWTSPFAAARCGEVNETKLLYTLVINAAHYSSDIVVTNIEQTVYMCDMRIGP